MPDADLERRIARLEAIEEIRKLKSLYCAYCDDSYNPDKLATLFTEDATWHAPHRGKLEGRAAIHRFFAGISRTIRFAAHLVMNEIIEVDGPRATGRWRMVMAGMEELDGREVPVWSLGDYSEIYVKTDQGWKIRSIDVQIDILDPATNRWTRRR